MTIHYHGTPITPNEALLSMAGRCFCVSYHRPDQLKHVMQIGQSVMFDNGAFSVWRKTKVTVQDWGPYYAWVEPLIESACHWAVIPDEIDAGPQAQDDLIAQWPFGLRGVPVWHMDEPIDRLLRLCDTWPRVCIGSTAAYTVLGSDDWRARMDAAFEALALFGPRHLPWLHMMRGMQAVRWGYPFASVDSTDVGRNHKVTGSVVGARLKAELWDSVQCPSTWKGTSDDGRSPADLPCPERTVRRA